MNEQKKNWENSDIVDKLILWGKVVNVLIPTDRYNNYINIESLIQLGWVGSMICLMCDCLMWRTMKIVDYENCKSAFRIGNKSHRMWKDEDGATQQS